MADIATYKAAIDALCAQLDIAWDTPDRETPLHPKRRLLEQITFDQASGLWVAKDDVIDKIYAGNINAEPSSISEITTPSVANGAASITTASGTDTVPAVITFTGAAFYSGYGVYFDMAVDGGAVTPRGAVYSGQAALSAIDTAKVVAAHLSAAGIADTDIVANGATVEILSTTASTGTIDLTDLTEKK